MTDLPSLREEIDRIDEQIAQLLSRRLAVSREIGLIKRREGRNVKDENRESAVMERWIALGTKYKIPQKLMEDIISSILPFSRAMQLFPNKKRNVVVYGYGGMGKSLASLLVNASQNVVITGRNFEKARKLSDSIGAVPMEPRQAVEWGDYVILAVPPEGLTDGFLMEELIKKMEKKVVMDILSSKAKFFHRLESYSSSYGFYYVSVHPLFGPYYFPVGEKIAVIPSRTSGEHLEEVNALWREAGLEVVNVPLEVHERAMGIVQVLPHFYMLGLRDSIGVLQKEMGVDPSGMATTNFRLILEVLRRISMNEDVIMEIQYSNKFSKDVRETGLRELAKIKNELDKLDSPPNKG